LLAGDDVVEMTIQRPNGQLMGWSKTCRFPDRRKDAKRKRRLIWTAVS